MSTKEQLKIIEKAATNAGLVGKINGTVFECTLKGSTIPFNPFENSDHALELAARLNLSIDNIDGSSYVYGITKGMADKVAAMRWAITTAASKCK